MIYSNHSYPSCLVGSQASHSPTALGAGLKNKKKEKKKKEKAHAIGLAQGSILQDEITVLARASKTDWIGALIIIKSSTQSPLHGSKNDRTRLQSMFHIYICIRRPSSRWIFFDLRVAVRLISLFPSGPGIVLSGLYNWPGYPLD